MKLYHGTRGKWLQSIFRNGIEPRGDKPRNNWKHVKHQSNRKCVYLSNSYAPYFALNAASLDSHKDASCAVIEIDTDLIDHTNLFPDEDFLEQAGRNIDGVPGDLSTRTLHYRRHQFNDHGLIRNGLLLDWNDSIECLGTCSYRGVIPPAAITRAVKFPYLKNANLTFVFDPSITIMNQYICGERYRKLTEKMFNGEFTRIEDIKKRREEDPMSILNDLQDPPLPHILEYEIFENPANL